MLLTYALLYEIIFAKTFETIIGNIMQNKKQHKAMQK